MSDIVTVQVNTAVEEGWQLSCTVALLGLLKSPKVTILSNTLNRHIISTLKKCPENIELVTALVQLVSTLCNELSNRNTLYDMGILPVLSKALFTNDYMTEIKRKDDISSIITYLFTDSDMKGCIAGMVSTVSFVASQAADEAYLEDFETSGALFAALLHTDTTPSSYLKEGMEAILDIVKLVDIKVSSYTNRKLITLLTYCIREMCYCCTRVGGEVSHLSAIDERILNILLHAVQVFCSDTRIVIQSFQIFYHIIIADRGHVETLVNGGIITIAVACLSNYQGDEGVGEITQMFRFLLCLSHEHKLLPLMMDRGVGRQLLRWISKVTCRKTQLSQLHLAMLVLHQLGTSPKAGDILRDQGAIDALGHVYIPLKSILHPTNVQKDVLKRIESILVLVMESGESRLNEIVTSLSELSSVLNVSAEITVEVDQEKAAKEIGFLRVLLLTQRLIKPESSSKVASVLLALCQVAVSYVEEDSGRLFLLSLQATAEASPLLNDVELSQYFNILTDILSSASNPREENEEVPESTFLAPGLQALCTTLRMVDASRMASFKDELAIGRLLEIMSNADNPCVQMVVTQVSEQLLTATLLSDNEKKQCITSIWYLEEQEVASDVALEKSIIFAQFFCIFIAQILLVQDESEEAEDRFIEFEEDIEAIIEMTCIWLEKSVLSQNGSFISFENASRMLFYAKEIIFVLAQRSSIVELLWEQEAIRSLLYAAQVDRDATSIHSQSMFKDSLYILCSLLGSERHSEMENSTLHTLFIATLENHSFDTDLIQRMSTAYSAYTPLFDDNEPTGCDVYARVLTSLSALPSPLQLEQLLSCSGNYFYQGQVIYCAGDDERVPDHMGTPLSTLVQDLQQLCTRVHYMQSNVDILSNDVFEKIHSILSTLQDVMQVDQQMSMSTKAVYQDVIVWTIYTLNRLVIMNMVPTDTDWDGIITVLAHSCSENTAISVAILHFYSTCLEKCKNPLLILQCIVKYTWTSLHTVVLSTDYALSNTASSLVTERKAFVNRIQMCISTSSHASMDIQSWCVFLKTFHSFPRMQLSLLTALVDGNGLAFVLDLVIAAEDDAAFRTTVLVLLSKSMSTLKDASSFEAHHLNFILHLLSINLLMDREERSIRHVHLLKMEVQMYALQCLNFLIQNEELKEDLLAQGGLELALNSLIQPDLETAARKVSLNLLYGLCNPPSEEFVDELNEDRAFQEIIHVIEVVNEISPEYEMSTMAFRLIERVLLFTTALEEPMDVDASVMQDLQYSLVQLMKSSTVHEESKDVIALGCHLVSKLHCVDFISTSSKVIVDFNEVETHLHGGMHWMQQGKRGQYKYSNPMIGISQDSTMPEEYANMEGGLTTLQDFIQQQLHGVLTSTMEVTITQLHAIVNSILDILIAQSGHVPKSSIIPMCWETIVLLCQYNMESLFAFPRLEALHGACRTTLTSTAQHVDKEAAIQYCVTIAIGSLTSSIPSPPIVHEMIMCVDCIFKHVKVTYENACSMITIWTAMCTLPGNTISAELIEASQLFQGVQFILETFGTHSILLKRTASLLLTVLKITSGSSGKLLFEICGPDMMACLKEPLDPIASCMLLQVVEATMKSEGNAYDLLNLPNGPNVIIRIMLQYSYHVDIMTAAGNILNKLSSLPSLVTATSTVLLQAGIVLALRCGLDNQEDHQLRYTYLHTLVNLMDEDDNVMKIINAQMSTAVLQVIRALDWNKHIVDIAMQALSLMAYYEVGRDAIEGNDGICTILSIFYVHRYDSFEIIEGVVSCLTNLACAKRTLRGWEKSIPMLLDFLVHFSSSQSGDQMDFLESVLGILTRLAVEPILSKEIADSGVHSLISVIFLFHDNDVIVIAVLSLLFQVVMLDENLNAFIVSDGATMIIETLSRHIENRQVVLHCVRLVKTITVHNALYKDMFIDAEMGEMLRSASNVHREDTELVHLCRYLSGELHRRVIQKEGNTPFMKAQELAQSKALIALYQENNITLFENGKQAGQKRNISVSKDGKHIKISNVQSSGKSRLIPLLDIVEITFGLGEGHKRKVFKSRAVAEKCINIITAYSGTLSMEFDFAVDRKRVGEALCTLTRYNDHEKGFRKIP